MDAEMRGFTLVELMLTVSLLAIGLTVAAPSFEAIINRNQLTSASNELLHDLLLTRSEALKRETRVTVCKKNADSTDCTTSGDWAQGRLVFVDDDADARVDSGERILAVNEGASGNLVIAGDQDVADYISYDSSGRSRLIDAGHPQQSGTVALSIGGEKRCLVVSSSGRPRINKCPE